MTGVAGRLAATMVVQARARYSARIGGLPPTFVQDGSLTLRGARHPLLAAPVPIDVVLDPPSRILLINASARNDGTCPGEISKSWRLSKIARDALSAEGMETDLLDLSRLTSDYDRHIHPCKACASTAMLWPSAQPLMT